MIDPQERLNIYWDVITKVIPNKQLVGVFNFGSWTYGLQHESSDLDLCAIITPTVSDLVNFKPPIDTQINVPPYESVKVKDIRIFFKQLYGDDNFFNTIDLLFAKYFIINPYYEKEWNNVIAERENIIDKKKIANSYLTSMYKRVTHQFDNPWVQERINKYGYNTKCTSSLVHFYDTISKYLNGSTYAAALRSDRPEYIVSLRYGLLQPDAALELERQIYEEGKSLIEEYIKYGPDQDLQAIDQKIKSLEKAFLIKAMHYA